MKVRKVSHRQSFVLLILFLTILGCTHQQVTNSPCATLNAAFTFEPRTDLKLAFGNDAIKAAVEALTEGFAKGAVTSVSNLTDFAKNAAVRTATANGKTPSPIDISELEKYLSKDVAPAIRQNPTCTFTVSSVGKPYIVIEDVAFLNMANNQIPAIRLKNTGQMESKCQVGFKLILNGNASSGAKDILLGPSEATTLSFEEFNLPMADIEAGKSSFLIEVRISHSNVAGESPITKQQTWQYKPTTKHFIVIARE